MRHRQHFPSSVVFSDPCHTLHPLHIVCRTAPAHMSRIKKKERQPQYGRDTCIHIPGRGFRCRVLLGSTASSQTSREQKHRDLKRLIDKTDVVCLQKLAGKTSFHKPFKFLRTQFRMFVTFVPGNVNAGGSSIFIRENLLPDRAVVTHEVTHQGRDHIVRVQDGRSLLVILNMHFEPFLCSSLRERLRRLSTHWPQYPEGFGIILGDFNICEPEEGRLNVTNQTFTDGDAGRTAPFRTFFPYAPQTAQPNFTRKDAAADGSTPSWIVRAFINVPMAEARGFRCYSHVTDNFGERSIPSNHVAIRIDTRKPQDHCGTSGQVPPWMSQHLFLCILEADQ